VSSKRLSRLGLAAFFYEGEGDCKGENGCGQFIIFGAIEENRDSDFSGFARMKKEKYTR